jgi:hypothetical protein
MSNDLNHKIKNQILRCFGLTLLLKDSSPVIKGPLQNTETHRNDFRSLEIGVLNYNSHQEFGVTPCFQTYLFFATDLAPQYHLSVFRSPRPRSPQECSGTSWHPQLLPAFSGNLSPTVDTEDWRPTSFLRQPT